MSTMETVFAHTLIKNEHKKDKTLHVLKETTWDK